MKGIAYRGWACLLPCFLALSVPAQEVDISQYEHIETLIARFTEETEALRSLDKQLHQVQGFEREALAHRIDYRALSLLEAGDEITELAKELASERHQSAALKLRLAEGLDFAGQAVFGRLDELNAHIDKKATLVTETAGEEKAIAASFLHLLHRTKDDYLQAMADNLATREFLGLPNDALLPPLQVRLRLNAETLAGRIGLCSRLTQDAPRQIGSYEKDPARVAADIKARECLDYNLARLGDLVDTLDQVGLNTATYRSLLAAESVGISVELIEPNVFGTLLAGWLDAIEDYLRENGMDVLRSVLLNVFLFVAFILVFWFLSRIARRAVLLALDRSSLNVSRLLNDTLVSFTGGSVMLLGILMALSQIGISLGPMLAGMGIAGFIIGFALQDTLANFAAGVMIVIYQPYDVDDFVEVTGASGVVKKMNLVSTTINTFDNQKLIVPNGNIWGDVIKNFTGQKARRVDLQFGISYSDNIEKAERILSDVAADHELVMDSPPTIVKVDSLGDSSVNLILRPWVKTTDYWAVYWDLTREVKLRFDCEGISIPFPQMDIHSYPSGKSTA